MSDLTRRVLEWHAGDPDEYGCFDPMLAMALAAPILAQQVEAVEALADRLEWEADPDNHGGEWDHFLLAIVDRIRDTLNGEIND